MESRSTWSQDIVSATDYFCLRYLKPGYTRFSPISRPYFVHIWPIFRPFSQSRQNLTAKSKKKVYFVSKYGIGRCPKPCVREAKGNKEKERVENCSKTVPLFIPPPVSSHPRVLHRPLSLFSQQTNYFQWSFKVLVH